MWYYKKTKKRSMKTKQIEDIQGLLEKGLPFSVIAEYCKCTCLDVSKQFEEDGGSEKYWQISEDKSILYKNTLDVYAVLKTRVARDFMCGYKISVLKPILAEYIHEPFILGCIAMSVAQEKEKNAIRYADDVPGVWKDIVPQLVHTKEIQSPEKIWNSLLKEFHLLRRSLPTEGYLPDENHFIIQHMKTVFPDQFQPIGITVPMTEEISVVINQLANEKKKMILKEYWGLHGEPALSRMQLSEKHFLTETRIQDILTSMNHAITSRISFMQPGSETLFSLYKTRKDAYNTFDKQLIIMMGKEKIGVPYLSEEKMQFLLTPVRELNDLEAKTQLKLNGSYDYVWEVVKNSEKEFRSHNGFKSKTQGFLSVKALLNKHGFDFGFKIPGHIENILRFRNYLRSLK